MAEYNILSLLHELALNEKYVLPAEEPAPKEKPAENTGPTLTGKLHFPNICDDVVFCMFMCLFSLLFNRE